MAEMPAALRRLMETNPELASALAAATGGPMAAREQGAAPFRQAPPMASTMGLTPDQPIDLGRLTRARPPQQSLAQSAGDEGLRTSGMQGPPTRGQAAEAEFGRSIMDGSGVGVLPDFEPDLLPQSGSFGGFNDMFGIPPAQARETPPVAMPDFSGMGMPDMSIPPSMIPQGVDPAMWGAPGGEFVNPFMKPEAATAPAPDAPLAPNAGPPPAAGAGGIGSGISPHDQPDLPADLYDRSADLGDDGRAAQEAVRGMQERDLSRGGAATRGQPLLNPEREPMPQAAEDEPWEPMLLPGGLGRAQEATASALGLEGDRRKRMGASLMQAGAAIMQGGPNFGAAVGQGIEAGVSGYLRSEENDYNRDRNREQDALNRWETERRIEIADQQLALQRDRFEEDKREAALKRLEGSSGAGLEGLSPFDIEYLQSLPATQRAKARSWLMADDLGTFRDPVTGRLRQDAVEFLYPPRQNAGLEELLGAQ